jgi:hypothetical protein
MKRRLPTTNQSEFVLVPSSAPPLTADKNRHDPTAAQPGNPAAACQAAAIAANAHPSPVVAGMTVVPPNSTANAANAAPRRPQRWRKRRHHPLAVV